MSALVIFQPTTEPQAAPPISEYEPVQPPTEMQPVQPPTETPMTQWTVEQLLAYASANDPLSCNAVLPFFRRGHALTVLFDRIRANKQETWGKFCETHRIGKTWENHARHFYHHYQTEAAIPVNTTLSELLLELGIVKASKKQGKRDNPADPKQSNSTDTAAPATSIATDGNTISHDENNAGNGTEAVPMTTAELPTEAMTDAELLAYAGKQEGIYRDLSCRAVIPFFRRGWALSIIFGRHKGRWTAFCEENGIGRTWATHARKFYAHYKEESAIPTGKTLNELLIETGILVQKVNDPNPKPKPKPEEADGGSDGDRDGAVDKDGDEQADEEPSVSEGSGTDDQSGDESPDAGEESQAKEENLLLFLTKVKALLDTHYQDKDKIDWSKEDMAACKEMAWEIMSACDQWINEVDGHALRQAS